MRLPFKNPRVTEPDGCWSDDERFVVYFSENDNGLDLVVVVPVGHTLAEAFPP